MSDLYALDHRLDGVGVVKEILHSMRALSAVQFRVSSEALDAIRAYATTLRSALARLPNDVLAPPAAPTKLIVVVMGPDQGLCGPLSVRLVGRARTHARSLGSRFAGFLVVGRQSRDLFVASGEPISSWRSAPVSLRGTDALVGALARKIEVLMDTGGCDGVDIVFARLSGVGSYEIETQRMLPVDPRQFGEGCPTGHRVPVRSYQSLNGIASSLLEEWGHMALYEAAVESLGSEHGARLRVTDAATHKVEQTLEDLRIERNHLQQQEVTEEIQEIIRGVNHSFRRGRA